MAKKKKSNSNGDLAGIIEGLKEHVKAENVKSKVTSLPSIIEFVEGKDWLGLSHYDPPIHLFTAQKLVLKCFYRGSVGNENLALTKEEIEFIHTSGLNTVDGGDILSKWNSGALFRDLVLVWGRRSGKDFVTSIISLYESMKLLEVPGGNPYAQFNLSSAAPFTILTIANSARQAHVLFKEIRDKVMRSPYFKERLDDKNITSDTMHFLTPHDRKHNEELKNRGLPAVPGSVQIYAGHSNSDSLAGISCYCLLLDEMGLYKNTAGSSSGDAIYNTMAPAVKSYFRKEVVVDEVTGRPKINLTTGLPVTKDVFDGKIVCISSPRGKEGIFYDLYSKSNEVPHCLMMRLPTWKVNTRYSQEMLLTEFPNMPEEKFRMEFGAEFSGTGGESFFPRDAVEKCFSHKNLKEEKFGKPGFVYFAHLDPALSSHNYALVICHKEMFFNYETNTRDFRVVVDHIKYWTPTPDKFISVDEVDKYMLEINRRFHLGLVTYDQWTSDPSIQRLRKAGVPAIETRFGKPYKMLIYDNLYDLVVSGRLYIPNNLLLKNEMMNLQRKYSVSGGGYSVMPKADGDVTTDDLADALAGACFNTVDRTTQKLPQGRLTPMPVSPNGNSRVWMGPSGPMGQGTGSQVAKQMSYWAKRLQQGPSHWR